MTIHMYFKVKIKNLFYWFIVFAAIFFQFISCNSVIKNIPEKTLADSVVIIIPDPAFYTYNIFSQPRPLIRTQVFDTLKNTELLQLLSDSLITKLTNKDESSFIKNLSPIQKTIFYFTQLDAEVRNGGLLQYYFNGYNKNLPLLRQGLQMLNDRALLLLLAKADLEYENNIQLFNNEETANDFSALAEKLPVLRRALTDEYYKIVENSIGLIVQGIKKNPGAAIILK
jgi:Domain of unknown function (DUF4375)